MTTQQELLSRYAEEYKERVRRRGEPKRPQRPGQSGPLEDVFLPPEIVDQMEAAIEEAFEQIVEA